MSQDDGKPDGTQDAFAAGLAIRRDMFGVEGAERQIEAATDFTRPLQDMVTRYYANFGKQDAAEDFGAFYTEDAVFDVNGIVSQGRAAIEKFYADSAQEPDAPATQGTFHMMISNPVIDVDGDTATAEFMWTGVINTAVGERPQLLEQGREYDLLVRQDGEWRIKKRTVIADSGLPERYNATYQPRMDYKISATE